MPEWHEIFTSDLPEQQNCQNARLALLRSLEGSGLFGADSSLQTSNINPRALEVVRHRAEHVAPMSFSRPFRASMQLTSENLEVYDPESIAKGPSTSRPSTPVPDLTTDGSTAGSTNNLSSRDSNPPASSRVEKDFLAF
ncbi:hypothetical protein FOQG_17766 [Fusarium oxysporum f. sp. raphani 54005]|uniref:Uncharacterized protein n=2 Tax=Fusarium oxysporum f. sp. raphani TaxID=96318 RepID=X0BFA6_FUSOX|nr:hypothetical protein FOQG_17766 [Fusarium oxysporum f. sp. raphani 54005]KAG7423505.1 hypothetical protein Forpi1262_v015429 [Fusarium oxysporum f. sp. raphani]